MKRDDIIRMAREAGLRVGPAGMGQTVWGSDEELERFFQDAYAAGAAAERDGCLKACEQIAAKYHMKRYATDWQAQECIAAIKARGDA